MNQMYKRLTLSLFLLTTHFSMANERCVDFVGEIERYKIEIGDNNSPIIIHEKFPSSELLIFTYQKYKDFSMRLDEYLQNLSTTDKEGNSRYISHCTKLLKLSEDNNKSKDDNTKSVFRQAILNDFNEAISSSYQRAKFEKIDFKSCDGYLNNATSKISEYSKSNDKEHISWIEKAIAKYEECKREEIKQIKADILTLKEHNKNNSQTNLNEEEKKRIEDINRCKNYEKYARENPKVTRWKTLVKDCQKTIIDKSKKNYNKMEKQ